MLRWIVGVADRARGIGVLGAVGALTLLTERRIRYHQWETTRENLGPCDVIIVPGLRLSRRGRASALLEERVAMAVHFRSKGLAPRLILSGGQARAGHSEASRMAQIARRLGVPDNSLELEPASMTTEDNALHTLALARRKRFRSALLVSHAAHLGYAVPVFRQAFDGFDLELRWAPVRRRTARQLMRGA